MKDDQPAFPQTPDSIVGAGTPSDPVRMGYMSGLSLRDWFAGQVIAGCAGANIEHLPASNIETAAYAYNLADAMLAERSKQ